MELFINLWQFCEKQLKNSRKLRYIVKLWKELQK